jgi:two-component system phosphate regulon sensor histidine kinase PhoR
MLNGIRSRTIFFFLIVVLVSSAGLSGYIIHAADTGDTIPELIRIATFGTLFCLAAAVLLAFWLSSLFRGPIHKLSQAARQISHGNYKQEIEIYSEDEIGDLAAIFQHMANQLKDNVAEITADRDRLAVVLAQMGDAIFIVNRQSKILMTNPAAERIFQTPQATLLERTFIEAVHDYEIDNILQQAMTTRKQQTGFIESRPTKQFLGVIATPLPARSDYLVIVQDLTNLRRLETVRRDFVANVSHELRTPIASLKALSETLIEGALDDRNVASEFLKKINVEVDKLSQMVQELVQLSQIESGQTALKKSPTPIGEVIGSAINRLQPLAERAGLSLKMEVSTDLPPVTIDKERIEQVLVNLIHNAIKFTPSGGSVRVTAVKAGGKIEVAVEDNGIGISQDDLPRMFERFYKTDKSRTSGGTGLGLSIAKHIVQAHGGEIRVESREGKGSTFTFSLPLG